MKRNRNRLGELGSFYHVFSRGLDRKQLFLDDRDKHTFLLILGDVLRTTGTRCYAFALMGNHYHNALQTIETPLSVVMHRLNLRYAMHFNRRHGGAGHVFQGRFQSVLIENEEHMKTVLAYVHLNPVRAGVVENERSLRDYRWTGHATLMGRACAPFLESRRVLSWFGDDLPAARRRLAAFTHGVHAPETDATEEPTALLDLVRGSLRLNSRAAQNLAARDVGGVIGDDRRIDAIQRQRDRWGWCRRRLEQEAWTPARLVTRVCQLVQVSPRHVRSGGRSRGQSRARALFCHLASRYMGTPLHEAARHVGVNPRSASRSSAAGEALAAQPEWRPEVVFAALWMSMDSE